MDYKGFSPEELSAMSGRMCVPASPKSGVARALPPKSREEATAHLREIERLRATERRAMEREAQQRRTQREAHEATLRVWREQIIPCWETEGGSAATRRLWRMRGIPAEVRGFVWRHAIGNPRGITPELFALCAKKARSREAKAAAAGDSAAADDAPCGGTAGAPEDASRMLARDFDVSHFSPATGKRDTAMLIAVDLPRTIIQCRDGSRGSPRGCTADAASQLSSSPPQSPTSASPSMTGSMAGFDSERSEASTAAPRAAGGASPFPARLSPRGAISPNGLPSGYPTASETLVRSMGSDDSLLRRLDATLRAFVEFRPDMGYVQGMSYIAAMLLLHMDDASAFVGLGTLMTVGHFPHFYTVSHHGMSAHMAVFEDCLRAGCPSVQRNFTVIGVNPQMYVIDWWMSLFSRTLPYEIAARCWDLFLLDGAYLYRISVCILLYFEASLHDEAPLDEVMGFLSRISKQNFDEDRFFALVDDSRTRGPDLPTIAGFMERHLSGLQHGSPTDDL